MKCETCKKSISTVEESHSMVIVLQKVTPDGYSFYQCDSGAEYSGLTYQHFHCNRDEMLAGVKVCINEHYDEGKLIAVSPREVRLHKTVLHAGIDCLWCGVPLSGEAYRFCLTHATPENSIPDDSMNELGEWCCSLEHAKQSVLKTIDSISGGGW